VISDKSPDFRFPISDFLISHWLRETDSAKLQSLWEQADAVRKNSVGDEVHLRGLIEISNLCRRQCLYCGIRAGNQKISRYRLTTEEVLHCADLAVQFGYGSIVIQSGEDSAIATDWIAEIVERIKTTTNLAITLSLGERSESDWKTWRSAGADRYLLRFETSNEKLFRAIHPPNPEESAYRSRIEMLGDLQKIGYEVGGGIMVGIPGQTYNDLARDILLFKELRLDMVGLGPFLPHPHTPLGKLFPPAPQTGLFRPTQWSQEQKTFFLRNGLEPPRLTDQVCCDENFTFTVLALVRILCPTINLPSTTAVATIDGKSGRKNGLSRGANVVMPNLTPTKYREMYEIYPNKAAIYQTPEETHKQVMQHLHEIGRILGKRTGTSRNYELRTKDVHK